MSDPSPTPSGSSPREVFARLHDAVRDNYDMDRQADLYAPDGVVEFPFAAAGMPRRIAGRETIRALLRAAGDQARQAGRRIIQYSDETIHDTADPEVIVAEFTLHGEIAATGAPYQLAFIQVLRVRDGQIVAMRDYFSPQAIGTALGGASPLRAAACAHTPRHSSSAASSRATSSPSL